MVTSGFVWKYAKPLHPMVFMIIIPMKNGYFIGNIPNIFRQTQMLYKVFHHISPYFTIYSHISPYFTISIETTHGDGDDPGDHHGDPPPTGAEALLRPTAAAGASPGAARWTRAVAPRGTVARQRRGKDREIYRKQMCWSEVYPIVEISVYININMYIYIYICICMYMYVWNVM